MGRPLNLHNVGNKQDLEVRNQIKVQAYINGTVQDAYLVKQKNQNTFVVTDAATKVLSATCKFVNSATPVAGEMSCQATIHGGGTFYVSKVTNRFAHDFATPKEKFYWGFVDQAPPSLLDHPDYRFATLPYDSRPAD